MAAHVAVRSRPWLAKEALEVGIIDEGEVRLTLDHRQLLDLDKFDSSAPYREAADVAAASVWARFEAQKVAWTRTFDEEKLQLEAKIREVREEDERDQKKHEAVVASLMAKFEAHQKAQRRELAVGRGSAKPKIERQGTLRASLLGGAAASANISGRRESGKSGSSPGRPSIAASSSNAAEGKTKSIEPRCETDRNLNLMREIYGEPLSECDPVRRWGATLVSQLGLNFYPTKPKGYDSSIGRSKRATLVPPRVARSLEEAFTIEPESEDSMYLSRYMLGTDRMLAGSYDAHLSSPMASTVASTAFPAPTAGAKLR